MTDEIEPSTSDSSQLPVELPKPSFIEWAESYLPFKLPRLALPQTAKNLDKAAARILEAGGDNAVTRIGASTSKQKALGEGAVTVIQKGLNQFLESDNIDLNERSMKYFIREARIKQLNRERIFELSAEDLDSQPLLNDAAAEISDDWLNTFSRIASEKSNDDIQQLWARLLAGEIREPGSVKLRTLSQLAAFDKDDANFAHDFLKNAMGCAWILRDYYDRPQFYQLSLRAAELGLIGPDGQMTFQLRPSDQINLLMGKRAIQITSQSDQIYHINNYPLTSFGSSLCSFLRDTNPDDDYYNLLFDTVKREGVSIADMRLGDEISPDKYEVKTSKQIWPVIESATASAPIIKED